MHSSRNGARMLTPNHRSVPDSLEDALARWREGDPAGQDQVIEAVYDELRGLARAYMRRERVAHTLEGTALVNEAMLRLIGNNATFRDRTHFFRVAAQAMRRILVDHARRVGAGHRIPPNERLPLDAVTAPAALPQADLLELDLALSKLATLAPDQAQIVELRCFVGLTIPEIAANLKTSEATVSRKWRHAKAWLACALE